MGKKKPQPQSNGQRIPLHQYDRLRSLHLLIANRQCLNTKQIAEKLEVHPRTVRRYIAFLRDRFGAPIEFDQGNNGFFYTHPNWEMPLISLTEGELLAFFVATVALQGKGAAYEDERLRRAIAKIAAFLPEEISVNLGYLFENTSFQSPPHVLVEGKLLDTLHRAVSERETIEFDYRSPNSRTSSHRKGNPLLLHNHEGTWYVITFDQMRTDFRDFHTARISNLKPTGEFFDVPTGWNKEEHLNGGFGMYRGGEKTEVEIIFDEYQSQWMRERNFFHPQERREELPDGKMKLSFTIGEKGLEAVARFCLQYAGNFVAVKPEKLREIIKEKLQNSLAQHQGGIK